MSHACSLRIFVIMEETVRAFCAFALILFLQALFQSAQHFYEKREESGSAPLNGSGPDPVGPETCESGTPTLEDSVRASYYILLRLFINLEMS